MAGGGNPKTDAGAVLGKELLRIIALVCPSVSLCNGSDQLTCAPPP